MRVGSRVSLAVVQVAVVCALPLPLVAILVTLTPPPHDPAKRNAQQD